MNVVGAIQSRARQLEAEGLAPQEAFAKAMDERPDEVKKYREQRDEEPVEDPYARAALAHAERLEKLERQPARQVLLDAVEQVKKNQPGLTDAEAWTEVHRSEPALYAAAKSESRKAS
jgi:hypothetical protein